MTRGGRSGKGGKVKHLLQDLGKQRLWRLRKMGRNEKGKLDEIVKGVLGGE